MVEVGLRLQKALGSLADVVVRPDYLRAAQEVSGKALRHAEAALPLAEDRQRIAAQAGLVDGPREIAPGAAPG